MAPLSFFLGVVIVNVWQEIFSGQKFCGFLKIASVSKFHVFVDFNFLKNL